MAFDPQTLVTQTFSAGGIVYIIQQLKKSGWFPMLTNDTKKLNQLASAFGALLSGAAIHYNWDQAAGVITITGVTSASLVLLIWHTAQQFVGQEYIYQYFWSSKGMPAAVLNAQADIAEAATDKVVHAIEEKKVVIIEPKKP